MEGIFVAFFPFFLPEEYLEVLQGWMPFSLRCSFVPESAVVGMHCGHGGFLAAKHLSSFSQSEDQHSDELASIQKMYWPNLMAADMISCYQQTYAFIYCEGFVWNLEDFGCVKKAVGCAGFVWNSADFGCVKKAVGCVLFGIQQTSAMLKKLWVVKVLFGIHQTLALLKRLWLVRQTWQPLF